VGRATVLAIFYKLIWSPWKVGREKKAVDLKRKPHSSQRANLEPFIFHELEINADSDSAYLRF
jgi:type II secretory pathway component PulM